jgi:hypothetical protein
MNLDVPSLGGLPQLPDLSNLDLSDEEIKNGPKDTLLVCGECGTIEHAFGPPEHNQELEALGNRHEVYVAGQLYRHPLAMTTVNAQLWEKSEDFRKFIIAMIKDATKTGDVGLGTKNYDLKDTFQDDAIACWRKHNRTLDCADYKTDKMKLLPDTRAERKELHMDTRNRPGVYLCVYCPFHSKVMERVNSKKGYY